MLQIDVEKLINDVRELATKYPDAIYESDSGACYYSRGTVKNGPEDCGCIFGQALAKQVDRSFLSYQDCKGSVPSINGVLSSMLFSSLSIKQSMWCRMVQTYQDRNATWSEAVKRADEETKAL